MATRFSSITLFLGFSSAAGALSGWLLTDWAHTYPGALALSGLGLFGVLLLPVGLIGMLRKAELSENPQPEAALEMTGPEQLRAALGQGGRISWLDRKTADVGLLAEHGRVILVGPMRAGKTREAVEWTRRAVENELVRADRVFRLLPSFRLLDSDGLAAAFEQKAKTREPMLLFLDDLPGGLSDDLLARIGLAVRIAEKHCRLYAIASARPEHIRSGLRAWLEQHQFSTSDLPPLDAAGQGRMLDLAAGAFGLQVSDGARDLLIEHRDGTPDLPLLHMRRLRLEGAFQVSRERAGQLEPFGLEENWKAYRRCISDLQPDAGPILAALAVFHAGGVTAYAPLIRRFARRLSPELDLDQGFAFLRDHDILADGDRLVYPAPLAATGMLASEARKDLIAFLNEESRRSQSRADRLGEGERLQIEVALSELAQAATDPEEKLALFGFARNGSTDAGFYRERAMLHFEKGDFEQAISDFDQALRLQPDQPGLLFQRAAARASAGQVEKALEDYDLVLQIQPDDGPALAARGALRHDTGDFAGAARDYEAALALEPANARLHYGRGLAFLELDEHERALGEFENVLKLEPGHLGALRSHAETCLHNGDLPRAIADLDELIRRQPEEIDLYLQRARAHAGMEDSEQALMDYNKVLVFQPDHPEGILERGRTHFRLGRIERAVEDLEEAIRLQPVGADTFHDLARAHARQGDLEKAIGCFEQAIERSPDDGDLYFGRSAAFYKIGDYERAVEDLNRVLQLLPGDSDAHTSRGMAYCQLAEYGRAIEDFEIAIRHRPGDASLYQNRGRAYLLSGDLVRTIEDYEQAIRLNPEDPGAYAVRGLVYQKRGDYTRAVEDYDAALRLDPRDTATLVNRGSAWIEMGDPEKAIGDYERALEIMPKNDVALARLGQALVRLGDLKSALETYDQALQLNPENPATLIARGQTHLLNGSVQMALADFRRALEIDADNNWAMFLQGLALVKTGRVEQGRMSQQLALQLAEAKYLENPKKWWNSFNFGLYQLSLGEEQKARDVYIDVIAKEPPKNFLLGAVRDVEALETLFPDLATTQEVKALLQRHM